MYMYRLTIAKQRSSLCSGLLEVMDVQASGVACPISVCLFAWGLWPPDSLTKSLMMGLWPCGISSNL